MIKTEGITLVLEQAKLKNMSIWECLTQICGIISSPLLPVVQKELMVYIQYNQTRKRDFTGPQEAKGLEDSALRADVIKSLTSEAKVNRRLKQLVRECQKQVDQIHARGQSVPECLTSRIYQDFPVLSELTSVDKHPLTVLCDHILERYDLNKDQHIRKVLTCVDTESLRHKNVSACKPISNKGAKRAEYNFKGDNSQSSGSICIEKRALYKTPSTRLFNNEYKRVDAGTTDNGMVLKLVRKSTGTAASADLSSEGAIAAILREAGSGHGQLQGAGFLVRRYQKLYERSKNTVEKEPIALSSSVRTGVPLRKVVKPVVSAGVKTTAFLSNVAKFRERFRKTSNNPQETGKRNGRKRKAVDTSISRDIPTKYVKTARKQPWRP